ncbi:hypothetical protein PFUM301598_19720 [Pseudomonas fluorescens]
MGGLDLGAHSLRAHIHAQWQGVDKHAQGALTALARAHAAEHYRAEHHRLATGDHPQYTRHSHVHHARHAHPKRTRQGAQATAYAAVYGNARFINALPIAAHILQAERQGRRLDIRQHLAEERLMRLLADGVPHMGDVAAKRHRFSGLGLQAGQVQLDFMAHHVERSVVKNSVVKQQHRHHALVGRVVGKHQAQQRRLIQAHAVSACIVARQQLGQHVAAGQGGVFARQGCLAPHHLQRLIEALPGHRGAQDIVAVDDPLQRLRKPLQTRAVVEHKLRVQHVGIALLRRQMMVEHALLERRQRVDILHIRRTTGDGGDNPVDGRLVEVDQRQHVRGDAVRRAQPVTAMLGHPLKQARFVGNQLVPQRVIQCLIVAQDDQVALFQLQTDRMGGNRCQ